jgi:hypothetical protein
MDGKRPDSFPLLVLHAPRLDGRTYQELGPSHPLYPLACFVYHHAAELTRDQRRGLFVALESAWPHPQGDRRESHRRIQAWLANQKGVSVRTLADVFSVQIDTVRRWIKHAPADVETAIATPLFGADVWSVQVLPGTGSGNPPDPADPGRLAAWLAPPAGEEERRQDDRERAAEAIRNLRA